MKTYLKRVVHDIKQFKILLGQLWKLNSIIAWYERNCYLSIKKMTHYNKRLFNLEKKSLSLEHRINEIEKFLRMK